MDLRMYTISRRDTLRHLPFEELTIGMIKVSSYLEDVAYNEVAIEISNRLYHEIMREGHRYPSSVHRDIRPAIIFVEIEKVKPVTLPETIYPVTSEEAKPKSNNVKLLL